MVLTLLKIDFSRTCYDFSQYFEQVGIAQLRCLLLYDQLTINDLVYRLLQPRGQLVDLAVPVLLISDKIVEGPTRHSAPRIEDVIIVL